VFLKQPWNWADMEDVVSKKIKYLMYTHAKIIIHHNIKSIFEIL
jgi:hypothetical protein